MTIYVKIPGHRLDAEYDNLEAWISAHVGPNITGVWVGTFLEHVTVMEFPTYDYAIKFNYEEDAVAFKLKFGL